MADNDDEGDWSPWEKMEGSDEEEEVDESVLYPERQPLIQPDLSQADHLYYTMDSSADLLIGPPPSLLPQYLTAIAVTMGAWSMGCVIGYSSPAGPQLLANSTHNPVLLTPDENNLFASSLSLGALVGAPICGIGLSTLGRKGTMLASVIPYVGGWLLIAFGKNFAMLMAGRILTGLCCGISSMAVPTYIGEYASPNIRGTLGASFQLMVVIGVLYVYVIGAYVSWPVLAGFCVVPPLIYCLLVLLIKESPVYLMMKGKEEKAAAALQFFRGSHYHIQTEMDMLRQSIEDAKANKASFKDLLKPYIMKPLAISICLMFFQQFSGINPVLFNLSIIFKDAGSSLNPAISSIIIGIVQVLATFLAVVLMDKAGRKVLLIASSAIMTLSLVALGIFCYLKNQDETWAVHTLGWLPLVSLIFFVLSFSIGYGPVPWLMMGELFSSNVKEVAASVATLSNWSLAFLAAYLYLPLQNAIANFGVYWLFASVCIINLIFSVSIVPETKGKSLDEITAYFGGPTSTSNRR